MKQAILVYNPKSGRGKAIERAIDFKEHWERKFGAGLILRETSSKSDIKSAIQQTYTEFHQQIIMGGDGTISEALQGLAELQQFKPLEKPVGILPAGSGNSFLRDFGIKNYPSGRDNLITAVENNKIRNLDMGMIRYQKVQTEERVRRIFCNIFGMGVVAIIAELAMKMRFIGSLNYTVATLVKIIQHKKQNMDVVIDGVSENLTFDFISICNSKYTGGAMMMAPGIEVDDGKLYLIAPSMKNKIQILKLFPKIFKGAHILHPDVRNHPIKNLETNCDRSHLLLIDGELERGIRPIITVAPAYWQLYTT